MSTEDKINLTICIVLNIPFIVLFIAGLHDENENK